MEGEWPYVTALTRFDKHVKKDVRDAVSKWIRDILTNKARQMKISEERLDAKILMGHSTSEPRKSGRSSRSGKSCKSGKSGWVRKKGWKGTK